jgi:hypothetical protein
MNASAQRFALTLAGVGVDSAWEQRKPEARKVLDAKRPSIQQFAPNKRSENGVHVLSDTFCKGNAII